MSKLHLLVGAGCLSLAFPPVHHAAGEYPLLQLDGSGGPITYENLPVLKGEHTVISGFREDLKFQLHNYLLHHDGRFWCMWSQGPEVEDLPGQEVRFATSEDGLNWSESVSLTGPPREGYGYIARGFWLRDGELLALAASFRGKGAFGVDKDLELIAFAWDQKEQEWKRRGLVYADAINNFAPGRLPDGDWIMTRRDTRFNVSMLIGGRKALDAWEVYPVVDRRAVEGFSPDEPVFWLLPDQSLLAVFRDNGGSSRLFRATSADGRTWTTPERTNFPNSTSKLFPLRLENGAQILISNARPEVGRREMHLSVAPEGRTFTRMARLDIPSDKPATLQYPHAIVHGDHLYIAFSRLKRETELLRIPLKDVLTLVTGG